MEKPDFKKEFAKRFATNEWETARRGGKNCPAKDSYEFYAVCYLQTVSEMKRLGYRIPSSYRMPKEAEKLAGEVSEELAKTWSLMI